MLMKRVCPYTKKEFEPCRSNQIYIDSKARIRANNLKQKLLKDKLAYINEPLRNNYLIIKSIMGNKKESNFFKLWLEGKGISLTNISGVISYQGVKRFCIYNYIIVPINENEIKIIDNA
jgi:hypothetical protein